MPQEGVSAPAAAANWVTAKMPQCHPSARLAQLSAHLPKILLGPKQTVITHHDQAVTLEKSFCTLALLKLSPYPTFLHRSGVLPSALREMCCGGPGCQGSLSLWGKEWKAPEFSMAWCTGVCPPDGMARSLHGRRFKAGGTGKVAGEVRETHSRA